MRTAYLPIWERIRANPGKNVPIEVPAHYLTRLRKAVKNVKTEDVAYRNVRRSQGKTGILYLQTAPHPTKPGYLICTYRLREYNKILSLSEINFLVSYEPPQPGVLETSMEAVAFNFVPSPPEQLQQLLQLRQEQLAAMKLVGP